jgi:predicted dehydrogenase
MRVAIIGAGLQTRRRAPVIAGSKTDTLVVVATSAVQQAEGFARSHGCEASDDWRAAVTRPDVDAVLVCTPPDSHAEISIAAMEAGKHVLCEKPLCRTIEEADRMLAVAKATGRVLKCGFNHRHHPAVEEARRIVDSGRLGRLIIGRCRYGIVGRPGYENEWRADPTRAVGGHMGEQGIHAIDLFRWFLGDVEQVSCMTAVHYFTKQALEDNGVMLLRTKSGALCTLHSSLTQWKNLFSFELIGEDGYLECSGLGASYGTEKLIVGRRDFDGPFQDTITEYRGGDPSWQREWNEFCAAIAENRTPLGSAEDGRETLRILLAGYAAERGATVLDPSTLK